MISRVSSESVEEIFCEVAAMGEGACGEQDFEGEGADPDAMLHGGAAAAEEARGEPGGGEEEGDLPEGVEEVGEELGFERWHGLALLFFEAFG